MHYKQFNKRWGGGVIASKVYHVMFQECIYNGSP